MAHNDSFKIWDWMGWVELKGAIEKLLEMCGKLFQSFLLLKLVMGLEYVLALSMVWGCDT